MSEIIRILIADDHAIVREGLRAVIEGEEDMELVGEASDGIAAVDKTLALKPDVVLMDLMMPRMEGSEAIRRIIEKNPKARILVLSSFTDEDTVVAAVQAGAVGFVLKDSDPEALLKAIREVYHDESPFDPTINRKLLQAFSQSQKEVAPDIPLTEREIEVIKLMAQGSTTPKIAIELNISERTVGTHISNILNKLDLENRTQAALYALRMGLVEL